GIGHSIAQALARVGSRVAVLARDVTKAREAAASLGDGQGAQGYECDVSDARQVETTVAAVEQDFGRIDVVGNNAGTARDHLLFRIAEADWDTALQPN